MFATTHWSVVLAAGQSRSELSDAALARLCETYWHPLYVYARRRGNGPEDAEDLTQQFFCRLLEKNYVAKADRDRGKFRTFLLAAMKNFLVNDWKKAARLKRGGGHSFVLLDLAGVENRYVSEASGEGEADNSYDKEWATALVQNVFATLRQEYEAAEKARLLEELKGFIWGDESSASYSEIGQKLQLAEGTVKVAMHRLRQRFRQLLRAEVAQTVSRPEEIDDELRYLIAVLG